MFEAHRGRGAYAVLAYHQVVDGTDGLEHAVGAERFRAQMMFLRDHGEIVPLVELLARWRRGLAPTRWTFALTFDDGYASLARVAHPILSAAGIPATIFLTTGFIDDRHAFPWWDRLHRFVAATTTTIRWDGRSYSLSSGEQRLAFFKHVSRTIVHDYRRLSDLQALLGDSAEDDAEQRNEFLDWHTVRALQRDGIFSFAPHTVSHPVLSLCANVGHEIGYSTQRLREELGVASTIFAYPYGRPEHFSARVQDELRAQGLDTAFTTVFGHIQPHSMPLALPRINIGRKDTLAKFAARLHHPRLFEWGFRWREFKYRAPA